MDNEHYTMIVIGDEDYCHIEDAEIQVWDQNGMDMSESYGRPADIETVVSTISLGELLRFYVKNGGKFQKNADYNPNFEVQ
jgi:hypothetical protein